MARRRLNKKVAFIGSVVFIVFILGAILLFLYLSRDPEKFIRDGDVAMKTAHEAVDAEVKEEAYNRAARSYNKARALAGTDSLKVEMLFKLADIYMETEKWRNVHGCWNKIIQIDPKNIEARLGRLMYFYIMADSGGGRLWQWQEIESQATEFIEIVENMDLLIEDIARWESSELRETGTDVKHLGSYLYLCRGRALLEIARLGAVTDPDASLSKAIDDLKKVRELEADNFDAYYYLAQAIITEGEFLASKGKLEAKDEHRKQAMELLEQAVEALSGDVRARIALLAMKSAFAREEGDEQMQALEGEYLTLVEEFDSSSRVFSALSSFYAELGYKYLDKAVEAAERAVELDGENVVYALNAANLHYRKFSIYGQKQAVYRAIEIARNALTLPDAQDKLGPRREASRMNRISLYFFLANCYIEQVLEPCEARTEQESKEWLANAGEVVHEIEQFFGSGEDPYVAEWQGMLELAEGDRDSAIKKLYAAYEQLKASGIEDMSPSLFKRSYARLSYVLAKVFEGTSEVGAVSEFLGSALRTGIWQMKPEVILDYGDVLLESRHYRSALSVVNSFEKEYWVNERSQTLRANIYIAARQFNEAEEVLAGRRPDDPNTIKLNLALVQAKIEQLQMVIDLKKMEEGLGVVFRDHSRVEEELESQTAELNDYKLRRAELLEKLLQRKPDFVGESFITDVCNDYIAEGKMGQAEDLVNRFLQHFPANTTALLCKQMLAEPEPGGISQQRRERIEEQVLSNIADPVERSMKLGEFYKRVGEPNKAAGEFEKVLVMETLGEGAVEKPVFGRGEEVADSQRFAADYLLEIALEKQDWELAKKLTETARRKNLDGCEGQFFLARLAMAKGEYEEALTRIEDCLKQRPIFSQGFLLKSEANTILGNEHASIESAQKAASLNPFGGDVTKQLAFVLYRRNEEMGGNASSVQITEARDALRRAVALNAEDSNLLSFYAEYIALAQPLSALAIRQKLQRTEPSVQNAVLLGRMATRLATVEKNETRKEALFAMAASAFEQAREIDPNNKMMLVNYAEYFRASGQEEKAKQLLQKSEDERLLWSHYFRTGRFEEARKVLEQLYKSGQEDDSDTVKGLLLVAEKTADEEAIKKYSEELLSLEDTVENRLFQIQTFLKVGLIKEAELKLESFKEKFPEDTRALLLEAWLKMKQGRLKEALELANRALETSQDNAMAWRLRGQINLLMADYDQAIIDLKRSKSLLAEPITRLALARAYRRAGRQEDAITELEATVDQPEAPVQARELLEQMYWQLGRREALKEFYDETLEKFPNSVEWCNQAGKFALAVGETEKAEQLFKQAWRIAQENGGGNADALEGYLQALIAGGKMDKVFEEAGKYVDGDFAPIAFVKMAEAKLRLNDKESSVRYFRKAVDKAGANNALISHILYRMYALLGAEEVLAYCKERLEVKPDSIAANMAMFSLKKMNGEYNKAVDYIDRCLQIVGPDSPDRVDFIAKKAEVLTLAYAKTSDNNYLRKAIAECESLLAKMPNNPNVLNNLAYMLARGDMRLAEALEYSERACDLRPNSAGFLDTYSYVLYKNGRFSEADESLQAALQQYEQNRISAPAEVYEHLGMIKEELGSVDKALAAYEQALEGGAGELPEAAREQVEAAIRRLRSQSGNKE